MAPIRGMSGFSEYDILFTIPLRKINRAYNYERQVYQKNHSHH
jgi:hypothetical protein